MSLFDQHKAERRARILGAARKLVAKRGYDGLTMRDLARAARVSVPTLYNLFGSKDAILVAELEAEAPRIAARMIAGQTFFQRGMAAFEGGIELIEDAPELHRAVMRMAMTSPETGPMRRRAEAAFIAIMVGNLTAAKQAGQLAAWADPPIVARHLWGQHTSCFLAWGLGEIDLPTFRAAALSGICHILAGVARGAFADEVHAFLRTLMRDPAFDQFKEAPDAAARDRRS
jgi:AcrR family transcriptional regulator